MKIIYDIFPAHIAVLPADVLEDPRDLSSMPTSENAYYVNKTRVVLTETAIFVAQDSPEGAKIIFRESYIDFFKSKTPSEDSHIITSSGKMLAFKKDHACGCGSRLRSWNAYNTITALG
jgi:hypothetical protein